MKVGVQGNLNGIVTWRRGDGYVTDMVEGGLLETARAQGITRISGMKNAIHLLYWRQPNGLSICSENIYP